VVGLTFKRTIDHGIVEIHSSSYNQNYKKKKIAKLIVQ